MLPSVMPKTALEVGRRIEPLRDQRAADRRHEVARSGASSCASSRLALEAPVRARERVRQVLDEAGHHVAAGRRERVVDQRGHEAVDPELAPRCGRAAPRRRQRCAPSSQGTSVNCARRSASEPRLLASRAAAPRDSTRLSLPQGPSILMPRTAARNSGSSAARRHELQVTCASDPRSKRRARPRSRVPSASTTPVGAAAATRTCGDLGARSGSRRRRRGRPRPSPR